MRLCGLYSVVAASTTEYAKPLIRQGLCRFCLSGLAWNPKSAPQERTRNGNQATFTPPAQPVRGVAQAGHGQIAAAGVQMRMSQQFADAVEVNSGFQQMCGKTVP